jgi:DNA-binding transcriptional MerR regulator/Ser/Thr protein kinase RdoA (MazF antagonist)
MLLKIGDFAKLSGVSPRMLRYYEKVGLLKPLHIDSVTGYRYYSLDQLPHLRRICVLRDLTLTLHDIALLIADDDSPQQVHLLLQKKQQELRQRIAVDQRRLQLIEAQLQTFAEEHQMERATERELFTLLLAEQYGIDVVEMELIYRVGSTSCVYRAIGSDGMRWELYAGRKDSPADNIYTTWLSGYGGYTVPDFLLSRAGILTHLEAQGYATQQVVRNRTGGVLGYQAGWGVLVTTMPRGIPVEPSLDQFRAIGAALGHLHTLPAAPIETTGLPIGIGWFYPEHALREALHYLAMVGDHIPTPWHGLLSAFHTTLHTIQQTPLPRTLIHGDPWIDKAVIMGDGQVTLMEWHSGGLGVAVLDLGRLLYACHLNPHEPWPWTIRPDARRITAALDGYTAWRRPSAQERVVLREAIQFGIAYGGTEHIAHVLTSGWTPKIERKLAMRQQWFRASDEIAQIAHAFLG